MFANRFKELRESKGMTQAAMDEYFGLMRGTVSNWENGFTIPEEELLEDIAAYFGVKVSSLTAEQPE
ncbi:MAG: helix-turn-helix transcriptional regulator [Clostridia bacterium]|nr:helix-turn-helix transcriptional regulator [Clostridia bacterium]